MTARDQANPEKTATANVYVRVRRDLKAPKFESLPYAVAIPETLERNRVVFRLRGRDDDKMVGSNSTLILSKILFSMPRLQHCCMHYT